MRHVQRSSDATVKDAQNKCSVEECVGSIEQRSNDAAATDVQTKASEVECARGTMHTTIYKKNLLHLDQNTR